MRESARALIIKDRKLLLVTNQEVSLYWSPGGGIEAGETPEQALARELTEELGVKVAEARLYMQEELPQYHKKFEYFLTTVDGEITPANEVESFRWFSRADLQSKKYPVTPWLDKAIRKLIDDELVA